MTKNFDMINAFGRLYFTANYSSSNNHNIRCKFLVDSSGTTNTGASSDQLSVGLNNWVKVSVSVKSLVDSTYRYDIMFFSTSSGTATYFTSTGSDFYQNPFDPWIYLGVVTIPNFNPVFPGAFREVVFHADYMS